MSDTPTSYPLHWPGGWKRWQGPRHVATFSSFGRRCTVADGVARLEQQLFLLPGRNSILSTNIEPTLSGRPRSNQAEPADTGAAVYFTLRQRRVVLACDKWNHVADNIVALAKHIESIRGQERWGVGTAEQAFFGYLSLPEPVQWFQVLGCEPDTPLEAVEATFRKLAKTFHPDVAGTGDQKKMAEISWAIATARLANGAGA